MKRIALLVAVTMIGLGSCSLMGRVFAKRFDVQLQVDSGPTSSIRTQMSLVAGSSIALNLGVDGSQSGALVGGSSSVDDLTMGFTLDTVLPDGGRVGGTRGESEVFVVPDPSIIDQTLADGVVLDPVSGFFMARFTPERSVSMIASESEWSSGRLEEIDEVVLRLANDENALMVTSTGETYFEALRFDPHFVITSPDGSYETYPSMTNEVTIAGDPVDFVFDYVFMVPSSVAGSGFSAYVPRGRTVSSPVIGQELFGDVDPSQWSPNPDLITDDFGNEGLFAAIDAIAGVTNPADRRSDVQWVSVAEYFQGFFTKYFAAMSTMFNIENEETGAGGLGNGGDSGFVIVALDDSAGPLVLDRDAVVAVSYRPNAPDFTVSGNVLDLTGDPPLDFRAIVVQ